MKLLDPERVDGTGVTIGRRVQFRVVGGVRLQKPSDTYTAVYKDIDGRWRQDGIGTTNRREARRRAIEIQQRLEAGRARPATAAVGLVEVIDRYESFCSDKSLAPKSLAKYRADLGKLREFGAHEDIRTLGGFNAQAFYRFRTWLENRKHKQGVTYAAKSVYATLTVAKQLAKWAWREGLVSEYTLASVQLPTAKARPQPCFTSTQVETILAAAAEPHRTALAVLAYSGMRIGELEQLRPEDVLKDRGELGMFHIRRGGHNGRTKDIDERFVPIHPRIRPLIDALPMNDAVVMPGIRERRLLASLKALCKASGLPMHFKLHSFRHYFASLCANHHVAYRKALAWMGHSSSEILELYYHLHDEESESAMKALAATRERGER
ncbi:MAG: tyrosine-type recombinase/integrase [Phycisphaerales bacterium]